MPQGRITIIKSLGASLLLAPLATSWAGIKTVPISSGTDTLNFVSVGASIGSTYRKDSFFWGFSADYARLVSSNWSVAASVPFDRDNEPRAGMPDKVVDTLFWAIFRPELGRISPENDARSKGDIWPRSGVS